MPPKIVLAAAAMLSPVPASAQPARVWQTVADDAQCMFTLPPTKEDPVVAALSSSSPGQVMLAITSPILLNAKAGQFAGSLRHDKGTWRAPIIVHHIPDAKLGMIGVLMPAERLDAMARSTTVGFIVEGVELVRVDSPGRVDAARRLRACMNRSGAAAANGPAAPAADADGALSAARTAGRRAARNGGATPIRVPGARADTQRSASGVDADLAAAKAAGRRVASTGGSQVGAGQGAASAAEGMANAQAMQAQSDSFLMLFRMNNAMANGTPMHDPRMPNIMNGMEY